jgi:hypothetical protein
MAIVQVNFNKKTNCSLQVGDKAYVSSKISEVIIGDPEYVGVITEVNSSGVKVNDTSDIIVDPNVAGNTRQFFSFAKDIVANESSLKGYYADVTFTNNSTEYAELFAISSEVTSSSK